MNARIRGLIIFGVIIAVAVVFCGMLPFVWLPAAGFGMALPIITVPGEVITVGALPGGVNLTNTLVGIVVADLLVIIFALLAWRSSKGWTKEVPGRFQAFVEILVETLYNFLKNLGGERLRKTPLLWPLVATIFLLLLAANWSKLLPGVESVGKMHCTYAGFSGYPMTPGATSTSYLLFVDSALNAGTPQTAEQEAICNTWFKAYKAGHVERLVVPADADFAAIKAEQEELLSGLKTDLEGLDPESAEAKLLKEEIAFTELRIASADQLIAVSAAKATLETQIAEATEAAGHSETDAAHSEDESHSEEAAPAEGETTEAAATEGEEAAAEGETTEVVAEVVEEAAPVADLATLQAELAATQQAYNLALSGLQYPGATLALTAEQLDRGAVPFNFHITPFVRGAASDLSLTVAYALMAVVLVQVYGVMALGPAYFEKFVNLTALGNLSKRPLGAVDFLVGIFEIISEVGKIISLAFRLFGNIFAGGVALIAISFLVSVLVPGVILLLEIVIGAVQALVFSVLTLVFVVQAMEHHGSGDDHGHGHGDEAHDHH
jgi:F0F1-type ATP synthase membrane subunit a